MSKRNYERLDIVTFGKHLLVSGDLDPIYVALNGAGYPPDQRNRWLTAYAAFYHAAVACWMSEYRGNEFWDAMMVAAENKTATPTGIRWPRGHERRHFRGTTAIRGIQDWKKKHPIPEDMFDSIACRKGMTVAAAITRAQYYYSVGAWLAFKIADLVDACMDGQLDQSDTTPFLYKTPRESLLDTWWLWRANGETCGVEPSVKSVISRLFQEFSGFSIPHKPGKPVDMFCIETVACKHGSHMRGFYPLWNDVDEITTGIEPWVQISPAAYHFAAAMPKHDIERSERAGQ